MASKISYGSKLLLCVLTVNLLSIAIVIVFLCSGGFTSQFEDLSVRDLVSLAVLTMLSFSAIFFIVKIFTDRIKKLEKYAKALINTNFNGNGAFSGPVRTMAEKYGDELSEISKMMLYMNSMLQQYMDNLDESYSAKERIETELNVASEIQKGILPGADDAVTGRDEFIINAVLNPAKDVGGDLYDYFLIGGDKLFFLIGDVSDKGIPAALFMSVTKTLFNTHALFGDCKGIGDIVTRVNLQLAKDNPKLMFVTVFAGILDLSTGLMEYIDGGHESPFILKENNEVMLIGKKGGRLPLGVMPDFDYETQYCTLDRGDTLILYTDGVIDAKNNREQRFGEDGIISTLKALVPGAGPETVNRIILEKVRTFTVGATQFDDIALLSLKYTGKKD